MDKKQEELVKVVMLVPAIDTIDKKTRYEIGAEVELPQERAEAAIAKGYAKLFVAEV
jgi:hypothetical protein